MKWIILALALSLVRFANSSETAKTTSPRRARRDGRDIAKERAFWTKENIRHEKELARVDARIDRLEWRLKDRNARQRPDERLVHDPAAELLEAKLESLRDEWNRLFASQLARPAPFSAASANLAGEGRIGDI